MHEIIEQCGQEGHDWKEMHEYFEQRVHERTQLAGDVRIFRATRSGEGTIGVRYTNISSNGFMRGRDWSEMYEIIEQRGLEGARLAGDVRNCLATEYREGTIGRRCTNISSNWKSQLYSC
ncbi:hypothetical protein [Cohnella abietis]|uniref:hypothetical protein n=1 Tax=Cohnella abietis TaxID=2507935 RepID=UPI00102E9590|nr:hypothetical protein [Cohnella abietis]